ncbi:glycoside hydrolase family 15 protein [Planctomyces sp. SH-PL62]|uniref:glycoside hydrolase family 15 protein n=1 Tax=Planctomyces sp. SH-PL62 TaxID=1636152 RepID=UPI00078E242E|nr:glycoside hydrolase family 15 protein [Planctomyces sp. SH-PL62]AMV35861.1 Trehalase [Planctomyces sp. SH-PL62]
MALPIEDYALIGDCQTAALVGKDGSVDWLCFPRFDSPACFAALLGTPGNGRWRIAPAGGVRSVRRRYVGDTLVLETEFETEAGKFAVIDFMPIRGEAPDVVRIVEGRGGAVAVRSELVIRFDYGSIIPWVQRDDGGVTAVAGPDALHLRTPAETHGENMKTVSEFTVQAGERVPFALTWHRSFDPVPTPVDAEASLDDTLAWWREWSGRCTYQGVRRDLVLRSLITLKALQYLPSGGIAAAATTSLPEFIGGVRNWDYRYCWLRDATFTLLTLVNAGYTEEARAWREWLLRAVAGDPSKLQIMYGLGGERRLDEYQVPWLSGYEGSKPVRVGNAASTQFQLDVYGEVADALHHARLAGLKPAPAGWALERALVRFVGDVWDDPDEGIWEVRGPKRHFTHSKVMAWVALDRAIKSAEKFGLDGPIDAWRGLRRAVRDRVCRDGFDPAMNSFVQSFGSDLLDASLLMIPLVGFLPPSDPRVRGTVEAVERHLLRDGFVLRYDTSKSDDGLPPGEGAFLACTFWLADNYALLGERDKAERLFERLCGLANDVGLLAEEYDPASRRLVGNFPQAFSHIGLVDTAMNLSRPESCPAGQRKER